jgi:hypothetical protein|tara:strand:- start:123 stop:506 length:384 start_codon:yes stop_codon:yes gene_type:complete
MTLPAINDNLEEDNGVVVKVYTVTSEEDFVDEEGFPCLNSEKKDRPEAFAKEVLFSTSGNIKYYLKRGKHGKLFNPKGLYSEGMSSRVRNGIPEWNFKPASKEAFKYYINFLKTKNEYWLSHAEREV